ncbi:carnitine racemase/ catalytic [Panicum miliaceum]|uniref:Carnitine racemase/ catalytic n=1 Tax=Panicum miliaceum TaxID=4540 RepID=A0A3L6SWE8_PANMI|nr:carnitine racemase/ catalytic [Panicum miliaceum]
MGEDWPSFCTSTPSSRDGPAPPLRELSNSPSPPWRKSRSVLQPGDSDDGGSTASSGAIVDSCRLEELHRTQPAPTNKSAGTICTLEQRGSVFVLTLTGDSEHRLCHTLISSLRSTLAFAAETAARAGLGAALVTVGEGRFFSNRLDIEREGLRELIDALRMPTVAAVTGHPATVGLLLALWHDYRLMREDRSVLYMSEVDIGLHLPPYVAVTAAEGKGMGVLDAVCPSAAETATEAFNLAELLAARKWDGGVYASIRMSMYPEA